MDLEQIQGVTLTTTRLRLTPLVPSDATEMFEVLRNPGIYDFIGGAPPTLEQLQNRYVRLAVGHDDAGSQLWFNWIMRHDTEAIGTIQATYFREPASIDVAWITGIAWQRRGFTSEAAREVCAGLRQAHTGAITAHIHPDHAASNQVAAAVGFVPTDRCSDGETEWILP